MSRLRLLVVDDDEAVGLVLFGLLEQANARATVVSTAEAALAALRREVFDGVVTDLRMPGMDGLELLSQVGRSWPDLPVVVLTAHGSIPVAVEAMKRGAVDFLTKPFERADLMRVVDKITAMQRPSCPPAAAAQDGILGSSPAMHRLRETMVRAASSDANLLIRGETGTGKELVARAIHQESARCHGPLVPVHCAALPDALLESELFGYEKGAFTGAATAKPGRVALAERGTLFLDEIGDVSPGVQVKLLRLLQEREFEALGGTRRRKADVRFVTATHCDLEAEVSRGKFRQDLFYRISVLVLRVPPLRERGDDVLELAEAFRATACREHGRQIVLPAEGLAHLRKYSWPGNVRELQNVIERLVVLSQSEVIDVRQVQRELPDPADANSTSSRLGKATAQREEIVAMLRRAGNNKTLAARLLGVSRRTLYNRMTELGIDDEMQ